MTKGKLVKSILIGAALLIVVLLVVVWFSINSIICTVVNKEGTTALGVQTTLSSANLNVFAGHLTLSGLTIANVPNYPDNTFLNMGSCSVTVDTGSLLTSTIKIPDITINGLQIYVDQNGFRSNLDDIQDKLNKNSSSSSNQSSSSSSSSGKQLDVGRVLLTNTVVIYRFGTAAPVTIPLNQIEMDQPTNPNGRPMRIADLIGQITQQIIVAALNNDQIKNALKSGTHLFENSANGAGGVLQGAGNAVGNLLNGLGGSNNNNGANK
ncbi:MAG TPA: hypothetical protein VMG59_04440 [Phycisphaerae bacterium]|nr:hypothetical protein [Phycisphaerae bacterium]